MRNPTLAGMRILVLEDEFLIALDVEQLCLDLGAAHVAIVRDCAGLPDDPSDTSIDFAVLDVSVGGESTLGFARDLAERGIPFIFATGYAETDMLFAAFPRVPVLSKPYSPEAFARAVQTVLAARSCGQAAFEPST